MRAPPRGRRKRRAAAGLLAALTLCGCASPASRTSSDFARTVAAHPERGCYVDRVPDVRVVDTRGAVSALASLLSFWGPRTSAEQARGLYNEFAKTWGEAAAVALVAQRRGCWAVALHGSPELLKERLRAGVPVLIDLPIDLRKGNWRRFSLAVGYDDDQQIYLCHEGRSEPVKYTYSGLDRWWKRTGYWMMVVCPPERATWTLSAEELLSRGRYFDAADRLQEAEDDLDRAVALDPGNSAIYVSSANVDRRRGHLGEAEAMYRKALEVNPGDSRAMNNLAYLLADSGDEFTEAETLARNALLLEPTNPRTLDTLGFVLMRAGRPGQAVHFLEQARARSAKLAAAEREEIALHLARAYHAAGQAELAVRVVAELRQLNPDLKLPADLQGLHPDP